MSVHFRHRSPPHHPHTHPLQARTLIPPLYRPSSADPITPFELFLLFAALALGISITLYFLWLIIDYCMQRVHTFVHKTTDDADPAVRGRRDLVQAIDDLKDVGENAKRAGRKARKALEDFGEGFRETLKGERLGDEESKGERTGLLGHLEGFKREMVGFGNGFGGTETGPIENKKKGRHGRYGRHEKKGRKAELSGFGNENYNKNGEEKGGKYGYHDGFFNARRNRWGDGTRESSEEEVGSSSVQNYDAGKGNWRRRSADI